jgi:hypothetical protein
VLAVEDARLQVALAAFGVLLARLDGAHSIARPPGRAVVTRVRPAQAADTAVCRILPALSLAMNSTFGQNAS